MTRRRDRNGIRHGLDTTALLRAIISGTSQAGDKNFFRTLVANLANTLRVACVFVTQFDDARTRARVLASWWEGRIDTIMDFDLDGTPCAAVAAGEKRHFPRDIQRLFPADTALVDMRAQGYLATPLIDAGGTIMGHLAIIDTEPLDWDNEDIYLFDIFAIRAAAELERRCAHDLRQQSEQWLTTILASVMDAVMVLDHDRRVLIFNAAAQRIFKIAAANIQGQMVDRLLGDTLRNTIEQFIHQTDMNTTAAKQTFLPEGLLALRSDEDIFAVDGTLSLFREGDENRYIIILRDAEEHRRMSALMNALQEQTDYFRAALDADYNPENIVAGSVAMQDLMTRVRQVAKTDTTVLLLGETGTGKELISQAIHKLSRRHDALMVKVNCAAMPQDLIESELFGHEKGAFTGATSQRKGRFELADGGTLFLDEVGELSPKNQAKLLRVLQNSEFERVGGTRTLRVNVRVITATNRDLGDMVSAGTFRADLFYRLNVFPLTIPPLRERPEDIPALISNILARLERKIGKRLTGVAPDSLRSIHHYGWPGNVRELQNVIERAAILSASPILNLADLVPTTAHAATPSAGDKPHTLRDVEREHILLALELVNWVVEGEHGAAVLLGMNPSTLRYRMQKLGIQRPQRGASYSALAEKAATDVGMLHDSN